MKELQKHQSWECATLSTHDDLPARPGSYAIVRLYDYDKRSKHGKASLWWTLAEILSVVEGDGISPDSLLEVRLFSRALRRNQYCNALHAAARCSGTHWFIYAQRSTSST